MVGAQPGMVGAAVLGTIVMVGENLPTIDRSNDFSMSFPSSANCVHQLKRDTGPRQNVRTVSVDMGRRTLRYGVPFPCR